MSKLTEADRQELRALFSQFADLHADGIIEEIEEKQNQANALKQVMWAIEARIAEVRADYISRQSALLTDD
jgi:hypothetical protein